MKDIIKFDPTVEELKNIVKKTSKINATDLEDKEQLEIVRSTRIELKTARVKIGKLGKELREEANAYLKNVLTKEKELIGIIAPEEDRLKEIETQAEEIKIKKARAEKLPARKERLSEIGDGIEEPDENLLDMDAEYFEAYYNKRVAEKNQKDKEALEAKELEITEAQNKKKQEEQAEIDAKKAEMDERQAELDKKERELEEEKKARAREEQAREDERKRLAQEAKDKEEEEAKAKLHSEEVDKAEKEKLEKQEAYRTWRTDLGWTEETKGDYKEQNTGDKIILWKKLGDFRIK